MSPFTSWLPNEIMMEQSPATTTTRPHDECLPLVDDRYRVGRRIGEGGMGVVYEAENRFLNRPVAIKALRSHLCLEPDAMARFQREAELTSSLNHPHIVSVLDMDTRSAPYFVMELLEGESLRARLVRETRLAQSRCVVVATQLLSALAESHERGILHRDVKPSNVFLVTNAGVGVSAKLLDFGIAVLAESQCAKSRITRPSRVVGSGPYMAPEQILGQPLGAEADLFSLGVLLYEALSGEKPFVGANLAAVMARIVAGGPPLAIKGVHPRLMMVVLRALSREPADRFASAREMSTALEPLLPRFSALNLGAAVAKEEVTERVAFSPADAARASTLRRSASATSEPPGPPVKSAVPLGATVPIALPGWLAPLATPAQLTPSSALREEAVAPTRSVRARRLARLGALVLLGVVGPFSYSALQRTAALASQARAGKMEWRSERATGPVRPYDRGEGLGARPSSAGPSAGADGSRPRSAWYALRGGQAAGPTATSTVLNGSGLGGHAIPASDQAVATAGGSVRIHLPAGVARAPFKARGGASEPEASGPRRAPPQELRQRGRGHRVLTKQDACLGI